MIQASETVRYLYYLYVIVIFKSCGLKTYMNRNRGEFKWNFEKQLNQMLRV